jgi:hypothetical protein
MRAVYTALAVAYVWSLPLLADIGFAKPAHSISGFIETPGATGALAVVTAAPLYNILQFEHTAHGTARKLTAAGFFVGFAGFLVFNVSAQPAAHYTFVALFALSFCAHAALRLRDIATVPGAVALVVGIAAFTAMAIMIAAQTSTIAFWATECVGFTALLLFTPLEQSKQKTQIGF